MSYVCDEVCAVCDDKCAMAEEAEMTSASPTCNTGLYLPGPLPLTEPTNTLTVGTVNTQLFVHAPTELAGGVSQPITVQHSGGNKITAPHLLPPHAIPS